MKYAKPIILPELGCLSLQELAVLEENLEGEEEEEQGLSQEEQELRESLLEAIHTTISDAAPETADDEQTSIPLQQWIIRTKGM